MQRLTNVTTARDILGDSSPGTGPFALNGKNAMERPVDNHSKTRHDDELLDASSPATRQLIRFTAASEAISTPPVLEIPIATTDFVTLIRRTTAVSCIEAYQTPAR
jgi:hypothetical protein